MNLSRRARLSIISFAALAIGSAALPFATTMRAQLGDMQARVGELKESSTKNKEALAKYTWTERVTISLNGKERKQERFQVRMGPMESRSRRRSTRPAKIKAPEGAA